MLQQRRQAVELSHALAQPGRERVGPNRPPGLLHLFQRRQRARQIGPGRPQSIQRDGGRGVRQPGQRLDQPLAGRRQVQPHLQETRGGRQVGPVDREPAQARGQRQGEREFRLQAQQIGPRLVEQGRRLFHIPTGSLGQRLQGL